MQVTLGITGASGMPIASKLLQELLQVGVKVNLVLSRAGIVTYHQELGVALAAQPQQIKEILLRTLKLANSTNLNIYAISDWYAPIASGSSVNEAMVICPCSMATLGKIAVGIGDDLIARAADVILKERKNLILVPRETPFSALHLENMLKLARLGVAILPPVPAFYTHPESVEDIIKQIVSRIFDQLGIANTLAKRW